MGWATRHRNDMAKLDWIGGLVGCVYCYCSLQTGRQAAARAHVVFCRTGWAGRRRRRHSLAIAVVSVDLAGAGPASSGTSTMQEERGGPGFLNQYIRIKTSSVDTWDRHGPTLLSIAQRINDSAKPTSRWEPLQDAKMARPR